MPDGSSPTLTAAPARTLTFDEATALASRLDDEIGRVIIGQRDVRGEVLTCLLAGGHCLLRGVPFRLALPDYPLAPGEVKPYHLEGGRLVSFQRDYAAYVAYRMGDEPVSLLVTSSGAVRPRGGEIVTSGALRFHVESLAGLNVITWTDKSLTYALASDEKMPGARSCLVCHGSPAERRRIEEFPGLPAADDRAPVEY